MIPVTSPFSLKHTMTFTFHPLQGQIYCRAGEICFAIRSYLLGLKYMFETFGIKVYVWNSFMRGLIFRNPIRIAKERILSIWNLMVQATLSDSLLGLCLLVSLSFLDFIAYLQMKHVLRGTWWADIRSKEEIWLNPMKKAPTLTENSKSKVTT